MGVMSTAVVTGGAGFLGSHLCDALARDGHRVICVDNLETGSLQNIEHLRGDDFVFVHHDVIQHIEIDEPVDFVFTWRARRARSTISAADADAEGRLARHPQRARAREVEAGAFRDRLDERGVRRSVVHPQPETYWGNVNPIGPRGVYDEAKRYAEALTMAYHRQQGVDTWIVRIFNTYGPRMRPNDGRAIPTFLRRRSRAKPSRCSATARRRELLLRRRPCPRAHRGWRKSGSTAGEHRQPGGVHDARAGTEASSRPPAPRARSCSKRCRSTIRRFVSPTSRVPGSCWAGSRR